MLAAFFGDGDLVVDLGDLVGLWTGLSFPAGGFRVFGERIEGGESVEYVELCE